MYRDPTADHLLRSSKYCHHGLGLDSTDGNRSRPWLLPAAAAPR